jgi:hypothetical protein
MSTETVKKTKATAKSKTAKLQDGETEAAVKAAPKAAAKKTAKAAPKVPLTDATRPKPGEPIPGIASNLWRVDRAGAGWSEPKRLPDVVNVAGQSIWKPS